MLKFVPANNSSLKVTQRNLYALYCIADGLAWDWVSEKIYWTDYCQDDIEVYDTMTGHRTVLFNTGLSEPHAIVVDPTTK